MLNTDKNIRYVALNTLLRVVHADVNSIQRHRATIVECLKDPDVSLKRRAMELCFALINKNNIVEMIDELMVFLGNCEPEFKADCSSSMFIAMERHAPNKQWHVDQMTRVLKTAGNHIRDDIVSSFIILISNTPDFQFYTMNQLVHLIKEDITQQPLVQVASWCLGEYGDQYASHSAPDSQIGDEEVVDILIRVLNYNAGSITTRHYAINALTKLSTRFTNLTDKIQTILSVYGCNMNLELQQRAVEYHAILKNHETLKDGLFEQMPVIEMKANPYTNGDESAAAVDDEEAELQLKRQQEEAARDLLNIFSEGSTPPNTAPVFTSTNTSTSKPNNTGGTNLDLLDLIDSTTTSKSAATTVTAAAAAKAPVNPLADLDSIFSSSSTTATTATAATNGNIDLLFGLGSSTTATTTATNGFNKNGNDMLGDLLSISSQPSNSNDLLNLFSSSTTPVVPQSSITNNSVHNNNNNSKAVHNQKSVVAYEKNEVKITLEPTAGGKHSNAEQHFLQMKAENLSFTSSVDGFLFSAAVPKTMQMQLSTPDKSTIQPLDALIQTLAISNPRKVCLHNYIIFSILFYSIKNSHLYSK